VFIYIRSSQNIDSAALGKTQVKNDRNLGILLSTVFFLAGAFLLHESAATSQSHVDPYLLAGAIVLASGLITASWAVQRHLAIRRLEQHVRGDQQIELR
jgi:hypothetical protein